MFWIVFGLIVYWFVHRAEQALCGLSAHESATLIAESSAGSRRAARVLNTMRPSLEALLLARTTVKTAVSVFTAAYLLQQPGIRTWAQTLSEQWSWPSSLVWVFALLLIAAALSFVFWGLARLRLPVPNPEALTALSGFILFWQKIFRRNAEKKALSAPKQETPYASGQEASVQQKEMEMLKSIVKFSDVTVKQVMQPRARVAALERGF